MRLLSGRCGDCIIGFWRRRAAGATACTSRLQLGYLRQYNDGRAVRPVCERVANAVELGVSSVCAEVVNGKIELAVRMSLAAIASASSMRAMLFTVARACRGGHEHLEVDAAQSRRRLRRSLPRRAAVRPGRGRRRCRSGEVSSFPFMASGTMSPAGTACPDRWFRR